MKRIISKLALSILAMAIMSTAFAQITTSNIAGRVTDETGPVAGAAVIAVHGPTGSQYYAMTNSDGQYNISAIRPGGPYTMRVEMLGYGTVSINEVYAPLAETVLVDAFLKSEALSLNAAVVSVDASEAGMNVRRSGAGTTISQRTLENVPTVSRSMNDIMSLTPQASTTTSGFAVGGGNYRGSSVTVDGAAFNNAFGIGSNLPAGGSPISLDAIEQISVNITPFDVRQSGFQGGAINAVTKSGSNQFHASVYDHYSSEKLRGAKVAGEGIGNSKFLNNTLGFTVGGPIVKDKLFFFVNAEYTFDEVPGSRSQARPKGTEEWGSDKTYNRPTVTQMEDMKKYVGDKFGYDPGRYQDYALSTPDYKVLARIDWNINEYNKLNFRVSHTHTFGSNNPSSSMSPIGGTNSSYYAADATPVKFNRYSAGRQSAYTMFYEAARYYQEQNFTSLAAELNSRLSSGKGGNMFRVAWSHQNEPRSYVGNFFPTVDILSNEGVSGTDTYAMLTTIGLDPFTYGNLRDVQTVTATDEFTYTAGKNNIVVGAQFEWNRATNGYMQGGAGWYIYDSWDSFKKDVENPSQATGPVAFMITHANLDDPTSQTFPAFDYSQASVYGQDEITFSDYFKLTAGLRLEMPFITIPTDNNNKDFAAIAAANPNSSFGGLSTADLPKSRVSVSPRIGFNWDVLKNRKLIVRGGTGIYTGRIPNVWLVSAVGNSNCLQYQYINKNVMTTPITNDKGEITGYDMHGNVDGIHFTPNRADVINQLYKGSKFQKQDLAAGTSGTILAKDLKMPSSWKSSLAIDAKLPGGIKGTLEGIYSTNFNEVYATPLGYKQNGSIQLPGEPNAREKWVSENIKNKSGQTMSGYYVHNVNNFHGNYYSVTAQLSRDWNNLSVMAAYTRSGAKSLSDGNGDQISEFANTYTLNGSSSPCLGNAFYVSPNRVIANVAYTINEGPHFATKLSAFYEGYNIGFYDTYSYSRVSYLMSNVSGGANSASQLIYIPTDSELGQMKFTSDANKKEFQDFLATDAYTKKHRGQYSERNGATAPWLNRINFRVAEDFYFNVAGRKQTIELGLDIKNVGNLINNSWGVYKQLSNNVILTYDTTKGEYNFAKPVWKNYNDINSTWQMLLSARWFF